MSGHSKWHNIQKTKGAQDAKRAAAFTKISKEMIVAVKEGGGIADPAYNSRLATVITKAKAANMPNDNIKRVLEKAAASGSGDNYETITYEGHGPCGVAVIVETMTDNRNRTAGSVRHHFDKYGGSLGTNGCVSWSFDRKGVIVIDNEDEELDEDTVMMDALDAGAADFQPEEGCFTVYTDPDAINDVAKALEDKGYKFDSAQIEMVPQTYQKLEKQEDRDNMEKMLDLFEEDDDVQNVWHNWIRSKQKTRIINKEKKRQRRDPLPFCCGGFHHSGPSGQLPFQGSLGSCKHRKPSRKKVQPDKLRLHLLLMAVVLRQLAANLIPPYQAARTKTPVR